MSIIKMGDITAFKKCLKGNLHPDILEYMGNDLLHLFIGSGLSVLFKQLSDLNISADGTVNIKFDNCTKKAKFKRDVNDPENKVYAFSIIFEFPHGLNYNVRDKAYTKFKTAFSVTSVHDLWGFRGIPAFEDERWSVGLCNDVDGIAWLPLESCSKMFRPDALQLVHLGSNRNTLVYRYYMGNISELLQRIDTFLKMIYKPSGARFVDVNIGGLDYNKLTMCTSSVNASGVYLNDCLRQCGLAKICTLENPNSKNILSDPDFTFRLTNINRDLGIIK